MIGLPSQNKIQRLRKNNVKIIKEFLEKIEKNNRKINTTESVLIANKIIKSSTFTYNHKSILEYLIDDRDQNDLSQNEIISFKFSLENFKNDFGWYHYHRNDDWQIYSSMIENLKLGIITRRDYEFLKSQFSSKDELVKKLLSIRQGDIVFYNKKPATVIEPLHFDQEKLTLTILFNESTLKVADIFLFKIKKSTKTQE